MGGALEDCVYIGCTKTIEITIECLWLRWEPAVDDGWLLAVCLGGEDVDSQPNP